ncbi:alpha/beta fold hydrolase [Actinomarinicola tropica]|uniref:Alpha/beta fold hydrolase n=1 Tax=Actinomarinicola tropica TaxID=2789776 RepID=A0A5Q2RHF7_9ACTN|nr:alpha/beta hydrolase [Actinomarinicola tropica]QGG94302.1 alpha/beta fold hydrolase [Actinomarinicola tropica]
MASFDRDGATIHYDDEGRGHPVLLIAPGGMRSANEVWGNMPWNPRTALADGYRLIGMDQRNAGRSTAPVTGDEGWATYAADQLALLDHLGIERCHVLGMCIGGPYILGLLQAAPDRFDSAVLLQPVGIDDNRAALEEMFDAWRADIADRHPEADDAAWASYRSHMWDGEFVLTASPEQAAAIRTPILLLKGNDLYHPASTSDALAATLPDVTYVERWKDDESLPATDATIKEFLARHTP